MPFYFRRHDSDAAAILYATVSPRAAAAASAAGDAMFSPRRAADYFHATPAVDGHYFAAPLLIIFSYAAGVTCLFADGCHLPVA